MHKNIIEQYYDSKRHPNNTRECDLTHAYTHTNTHTYSEIVLIKYCKLIGDFQERRLTK